MRILLGFAVVAVAALTAVSPAFAVTYQTVALSGQQAPGMPEGVIFGPQLAQPYYQRDSAFPHYVSLNNAGQVAFKGYMQGGDLSWQQSIGLWAGKAGELSLVAQTGQPTPGVPGEVLSYIAGAHYIVINDAGEVGFRGKSIASITEPDTGQIGYWAYGAGGLHLAALSGQAAPGTPEGTVFNSLGASYPMGTLFGGSGQFAFRANTTAGTGYWYGRAGELQRVEESGTTPLPAYARVNDYGVLGVLGSIEGGSTDVWRGNPQGAWERVVAVGDPAPGAPQGSLFQTFYAPGINDAGQLAWWATASRTSADPWTGSGIWMGQPGSVQSIAVKGEQAPNFAPGTSFTNFARPQSIHVNAQGKSAFWATVNGPAWNPIESLWIGSADSLQLIARNDQPLPGTTSTGWEPSFQPSMNAAGQVLFSVGSSGSGGIWATDPLGTLRLIAITGQEWQLPSGETKIIAEADALIFDGSGGQDGIARPINDAGWVAFGLVFKDKSSGIFLADTNIPGRTAGILKGANQRGELVGNPGTPGHVAVTFPTTEAGIFLGTLERIDEATFNRTYLTAAFSPVLSPAGDVRMWDLNFTGSFTGLATLEITYDESWLNGLDESMLGIYHHRDDGAWELLPGAVDPLTNTLTVTTDTFCNFALGVVPEPASTASLAALALLMTARRRRGI